MLKKRVLSTLVLISSSIFWSACVKSEREPDAPFPDGRWNIRWSYTAGNSLIGGSPGSSQQQWRNILQDGTSYDVRPIFHSSGFLPSDAPLHWNFLTSRVTEFLRGFYSNDTTFSNIRSRYSSFLFGVNTPTNTPPNTTDTTNVLGVTIPFGQLPVDVDSVAVSLVFTSKAFSIPNLDTEGRWRVVQYVLIHELGHARGLNAGNGTYDHNNHGGQLVGWCVMRNLSLSELSSHSFCDYHKRILRRCLPIIKGTYDPLDACTNP